MAIDEASVKIAEWREHPALFVEEAFGVRLDKWQKETLEAFPHAPRIAMKACKGPGKSAVLAWINWNFLLTRPHPKGLAVSVTGENLRDGLWTELAHWRKKCSLLEKMFDQTTKKVFCKEHPDTWYVSARTFPKTADPNQMAHTLAGIHADYVMITVDESGDIPPAVLLTANAIFSGSPKEAHLVQAGNPVSREGMLYHAAYKETDRWYVVTITGDPEDKDRSPRIPLEEVKRAIEQYGRDDPYVKISYLGEFPDTALNTLLGDEEVEAAMNRQISESEYMHAQIRMGVDVARFGDDETAICIRHGLRCYPIVVRRSIRTQDLSSLVVHMKNENMVEEIFVDGTGGYGAGLVDSLLQLGHPAHEVHFSSRPDQIRTYANRRAEMYFRLANWVKRGGVLPRDNDLRRQLASPTYSYKGAGKFVLEPKDQIKKRLGFSPDRSDALALTFAIDEMPGSRERMIMTPQEYAIYERQKGTGSTDIDWDPINPKRRKG